MSGEEIKNEDNKETGEKNIGSSSLVPNLPAYPPNTEEGSFNAASEIEKLRKENTKDLDRINYFFIGLVVFVTVTFIIQMWVTNLDRIKDKDLYLKYDSMSEKYFDRYLEINKSFNDLSALIKDQKIEDLKGKNAELKNLTDCLKSKKYWQYEQCF